MAPNNALGKPTAAKLRAAAEGERPSRRRSKSPAAKDIRSQTADGFGAGMIDKSEVASRGTGTAIRTPLDEFEAKEKSEVRAFWTAVMFLTRLPCPGWCDHHPGYLMRGMAYFPLVGGAIVGVWAASIYDAAATLWPPLVAAAISSGGTLWLTGCFHEDGLCDTLDGFGGGWTKAQILLIMKDSRSGSYATMAGSMWVLAKCAILGHLGSLAAGGRSVWAVGASVGAGPAILVAQCVARASAAPLVYTFDYVVDDADPKGDYYNWFAETRRLLGLPRVFVALATAAACAYGLLPAEAAERALLAGGVGTVISGLYGKSVLGGVMGDFLGATICMLELAVYLAIAADVEHADASALTQLAVVLSLPQFYGVWRRFFDANWRASQEPQEC